MTFLSPRLSVTVSLLAGLVSIRIRGERLAAALAVDGNAVEQHT
jgi:hypothetical protein